MTAIPLISVIVPIHNEQADLEQNLRQIQQVLYKSLPVHELILVDDGSTDNSYQIMRSLPGAVCLQHKENLGYGAALKTGLRKAQGQWLLIIDADGTYPPTEINKLLPNYADYEMVVGARTGDIVKIPAARKPAKWILSKLANFLARKKIPDLNSGLRLFRKATAERFLHLLPDGFSFTTTITLAMLSDNLPVKFVPINYLNRPKKSRSKINPIGDFYNFIMLIIKTVIYFNPLRVFLPISLLLIMTGLVFGLYRAVTTYNIPTTAFLLFVTGLQIAMLGLLADLINKRAP